MMKEHFGALSSSFSIRVTGSSMSSEVQKWPKLALGVTFLLFRVPPSFAMFDCHVGTLVVMSNGEWEHLQAISTLPTPFSTALAPRSGVFGVCPGRLVGLARIAFEDGGLSGTLTLHCTLRTP